MTHRAFFTTIFALILGVLTVYAVGSSSFAHAFVSSTTPRGMTQAEVDEAFKSIVRSSQGGPDVTPSQTRSARGILTRSATSKMPKLLPHLVKANLATAAAGIWIHNGVTLYQGLNPQHLDIQFGTVPASSTDRFGGAPFRYEYWPSSSRHDIGTGVITRVDWSVNSSGSRYSYKVHATVSVESGCIAGIAGVSQITSDTHVPTLQQWRNPSSPNCTSTSGTISPYVVIDGGSGSTIANNWYIHSRVTTYPDGYNKPSQLKVIRVGPPLPTAPNSSLTYLPQPYKVGSARVIDSALPGSYEATPEESDAFKNAVVASPEAPTVVPEEDLPLFEPSPDWDPNTDPFSPLNDPFLDPDADPDGDGIPNRTDDDPEGDGDPDQDGSPNEHPLVPSPSVDPDGDGIPNEEDDDDDGDGRPDTEDDNPTVAEPLPNPLSPDADPDGDGIPNRDDPDQDGDGIPNTDDPTPTTPTSPGELPLWHPYADPDEDGTPNREDKDDDGDGREDWEDERPFIPASNPDEDTDGDGVPDWSDPWPGNPYAPHDPDLDKDGDGVPDYKDPEPGVPYIPWRTTTDDPDAPDRQLAPPGDPDVPYNPDTPPWSPNTPGTPNVPSTPGNPASPPYAPGTPNPPDVSTGISSPPPARSDVPDDPTTTDTPDVPSTPGDPGTPGNPGDPPPGDPGDPPPTDPPTDAPFCPVAPTNRIQGPDATEYGSVFPFNLLVMALDVIVSLNAPPKAPPVPQIFPSSVIGESSTGSEYKDLSFLDGPFSIGRNAMKALGLIGAGIMLYKMFSQSTEGS